MKAQADEGHAVVPALAVDLMHVEQLLRSAGLPTEGLADQFPNAYVVVKEGPDVIALAGLESYRDACLLRSVVVDARFRGRGLGAVLVEDRLRVADELGVATYLLTTTGADYFPRHGFRPTPRTGAPLALRASIEFTSASPESAVCLVRDPRLSASFSPTSRLDR